MSDHSLNGRVVAVTGASRGIGRAIVEQLLAAGATVVAGAREVLDMPHPHLLALPLDVTSESSVETFAEHAVARGVDALVNNAGVGSFVPVDEFTVAEYRRIMDTNVLGTLLTTRSLIPHFKQRHAAGQRSCVVNVTSDVSARTFSNGALYTASKFAQRAITQTLAREGEAYGLRVTEVRPGMVDTYFNERVPGTPERATHLMPDDVARAVLQALAAPPHVRIDEIVLHPVAQSVVF